MAPERKTGLTAEIYFTKLVCFTRERVSNELEMAVMAMFSKVLKVRVILEDELVF